MQLLETVDRVSVLQIKGTLCDYQSLHFQEALKDLCRSTQNTIFVVDFKAVSLIDSRGLGAMVSCLKLAEASQNRFVLCGLDSQVRMVFELTQLDRVFAIYSDLNQVLQAFGLSLTQVPVQVANWEAPKLVA